MATKRTVRPPRPGIARLTVTVETTPDDSALDAIRRVVLDEKAAALHLVTDDEGDRRAGAA